MANRFARAHVDQRSGESGTIMQRPGVGGVRGASPHDLGAKASHGDDRPAVLADFDGVCRLGLRPPANFRSRRACPTWCMMAGASLGGPSPYCKFVGRVVHITPGLYFEGRRATAATERLRQWPPAILANMDDGDAADVRMQLEDTVARLDMCSPTFWLPHVHAVESTNSKADHIIKTFLVAGMLSNRS